MTDREALYRAIIANPDEDTPRFVFADWLEEHDEPEHAEFIRIGCQLEANTPDHPEYVEWLTRQEELTCWLATHAPGPQPKFPAGLEVSGGENWWRSSRRGFPRYLEFDGNHHHGTAAIRALAKSLEKAFASLPTRWLAVRFITNEQLAELLRQPILAQLEALTLQLYARDEPNDEAAQLVAECPHLKNLRGLNLGFDFGDAGAEALGQSENLRRIDQLSISGTSLTTNVIRRLHAGSWFRNLHTLALSDMADGSFEQLCEFDAFPRLHTLRVPNHAISVVAWEMFCSATTFPALSRLEFPRMDLSGGGIKALAEAKWLRPAYVDLDNCWMGNAGAEALAATPWLDSVRWLGLRNAGLTAKGVSAIASSKKLANLKHLDLSFNNIGAAGLRVIAKNPALRGLLSLNVSGQPASVGHLKPEHLPQLRYLSLRGRSVGPKAARLLAQPKFASLRRLDLGSCGLTDAAVKALFEAPALQNLVELRLDGNNLKSGVEPLIDPNVMPRLGACYLDENRLGDELKAKLRKRPGMKV